MVSMEALSGSGHVLLMMLGVTVVIITLRVIAREHRIKRQASARQATTSGRRIASPLKSPGPASVSGTGRGRPRASGAPASSG